MFNFNKTLFKQNKNIFKTLKKKLNTLICKIKNNLDSDNLTEDQISIQDSAYQFAKNELAPFAHEWDKKKIFPLDVYKKAAEIGFAGNI